MKKLLLLLMICFLFSGCVSYTELDDLSIVSTIGIDYQNGKYQLYVQVINGKLEEQEVEKEVTTFSSEKESLEEAFFDIYAKSTKRLYLSHMDLLLLTKDAINQKFVNIIHTILENNEYRHNFHVAFLTTPLKDFMNSTITSEDVNDLIKINSQETSTTSVKEFEEMMKDLLIDKNTYIPSISYQEKLTLEGYALIQNYQFLECLSKQDSILLNLLTNKVQKAYLNETNISENQTFITTKKNQIMIHIISTIEENKNWVTETKPQLENFLLRYQQKNYDILKILEKVKQNDYNYYRRENHLLQQLNFHISIETRKTENYLKGDYFHD